MSFMLIWLQLLCHHCAKRLILWMLTKKKQEGQPTPARQTGCYSWIHKNIPLEVVSRGENIFNSHHVCQSNVFLNKQCSVGTEMIQEVFQLNGFFVVVCCPSYLSLRIIVWSLAPPGLRQRHKLCPYHPFIF